GRTNVVELKGPVDIRLDHTRLTADNAVIWLHPLPGGLLDEQRVEISLIGNARLTQEGIVRTETNLLVTAVVTGTIRLNGDRTARDDSGGEIYQLASAVRRGQTIAPGAPAPAKESTPQRRWSNSTATRVPTSGPTTQQVQSSSFLPKRTLELHYSDSKREVTPDGKLAYVISGDFVVRSIDPKGDMIEFLADNAVIFTDLARAKDARESDGGKDSKQIADHVVSAYFEGDVRVYTTPADGAKNALSMRADRVYYEFATDRAVMTDVVFHTVDFKKQMPIYMRASKVRQLSQGEFKAENVELTTSAFATPTYSLAADKAYVRSEPSENPNDGSRVTFAAENTTLRGFGVPFFWLPESGGTMTSRGTALRGASIEDSSDFGFGVRTQWGLFETLGQPAPSGLDADYRIDYFGDRGPAGGLDAKYNGGFITETTKDPWNFLGELRSYFVDDHGTDHFGGLRTDVPVTDAFRGRAYLEHQHFFPDDWQAQLRLGWVSDANFRSQWFFDEFQNGSPINESIYLKHQKDSEVFTLLTEWQPNDVVTTSETIQEQREVEYIPEFGYHRVGDGFADDTFTFFSDNSAAGMRFSRSGATLAEQGFGPGLLPGKPSFAYTGDPGTTTWRGDFRQEIDWPINAGPFKMVPYTFARYTVYSQGVVPPAVEPQVKTIPTGPVARSSDQNRVMAGTGFRISTAFWRVDDTLQSDLLDIHRIRHVIEPEINLFASAQTIDQSRLFIYDENVDAVNDVQAIQVALRQRWQTKRGGPGRWRSVDFFTFNVYGNFFANQPAKQFRDPADFRGAFFATEPETSLARNSLNMDSQWRISDSMTVLADASENLDYMKFATGSIGLAVQRDERLSYFIGNRYIADLNSSILTVEMNYQLTRKYGFSAVQSFDFGAGQDVYYSFSLNRKFDRFLMAISLSYDQTTDNKGISFQFVPYGLRRGFGSDRLAQHYQQ
ncbi:MAG TPA: LPS assembly protein LptD, partial [Tepidisphaeraceae bacterium]|nr:LPS assembly protein LptD [Tepidisphaeraceae bacterium]